MDFGFNVCLLIVLYFGNWTLFYISYLCIWVNDIAKRSAHVVFPELVAPTIMTPNLTLNVSNNWIAFFVWFSTTWSFNYKATFLIYFYIYSYSTSFISDDGNKSQINA